MQFFNNFAEGHPVLSTLREAGSDPLAKIQSFIGMGEGEFLVDLRDRELGSTGADEAVFLVRPNAGLPFAPAAETASGGELSRIALALAAVAGGETLVFDEIDAGIGGVTAENARGLAAAGADFLAVSAGVWSHPGGEARAVRDLNAAIAEGLADRSRPAGA